MLDALFARDLATSARVLAVGTTVAANDPRVVRVENVAEGQTPFGGFDAALLRYERAEPRLVRALRSRVRPGGQLVLLLPRARGLSWLRKVVGAEPSDEERFETLCAAPLLAGLEGARVVEEGEVTAVVARVPAPLDPLDEHFTQPP